MSGVPVSEWVVLAMGIKVFGDLIVIRMKLVFAREQLLRTDDFGDPDEARKNLDAVTKFTTPSFSRPRPSPPAPPLGDSPRQPVSSEREDDLPEVERAEVPDWGRAND
ncbi:MAG: hypothetical protein ACRDUW_17260 [Pseudonocardiaceae bacterium]